jgi:hypothetical protein
VRVIRSIVALLAFAVGACCSTPGASPHGADALVIAQAWDYNAYEVDKLVFSISPLYDVAQWSWVRS